jgi:predicted DNA binding CopG/RHH family protein
MKKAKLVRKHAGGRPPLPAAEKKKPALGLRLTDAELERVRANAAAAGQTVAGYVVARCCR